MSECHLLKSLHLSLSPVPQWPLYLKWSYGDDGKVVGTGPATERQCKETEANTSQSLWRAHEFFRSL